MYDRFTDRARKVMGLARHEAQRFNHDYIGTEHLLLGLIGEGSGVAASVLKGLGINLENVRKKTERLVSTGTTMVTMGQLPLTPRAKKVLELSFAASTKLGHTYVGSEHLLLGLIREGAGIASQVLSDFKITPDVVEQEVMHLLGAEAEEIAQTPKCAVCGKVNDNKSVYNPKLCTQCNKDLVDKKVRKERQEGSLVNRGSAISVAVIQEMIDATQKHGRFNSPHEGWGVIWEEVDELWDEVRAKVHDKDKMRKECIQIAAMAFRYIMDVCEDK